MSKILLVLTATLAALALAGTASAAATVQNDEVCTNIVFGPFVLGTTCVVTKTTTNTTTTKSGVTSYVVNGTKDSTTSFVWGDTQTRQSEIHEHNLLKDGVFAVSSSHYEETWQFPGYSCIEAYDIHWANGASQFGDFVLECRPV